MAKGFFINSESQKWGSEFFVTLNSELFLIFFHFPY
jgi:hypothetical protein